jgi:hypothetical protein
MSATAETQHAMAALRVPCLGIRLHDNTGIRTPQDRSPVFWPQTAVAAPLDLPPSRYCALKPCSFPSHVRQTRRLPVLIVRLPVLQRPRASTRTLPSE